MAPILGKWPPGKTAKTAKTIAKRQRPRSQ